MGYLVSESKFLIADSLQAFVKHLVAGGKPEGGGGGSGSSQEPLGSPLDDEGGSVDVRGRDNPALFFQEMLVRITMQVHSLEHRLGRNKIRREVSLESKGFARTTPLSKASNLPDFICICSLKGPNLFQGWP